MGHNRPMRRFVILFWIFSLVASNLAWAIDTDGLGLSGEQTTRLVATDDGTPLPDKTASGHCNHCCHGSAHLTGLLCVADNSIPPLPPFLPDNALDIPLPTDRVPPTPPPNI